MADVTTTFAAKDESFAKTVDNLNGRLQGFQGETQGFTSKVGEMAKSFAAFAIPIAGVAAAFFGARSAVGSFSNAIRIGGELNDLSARTGETAGRLAILQRAFENAGAGAGQVGPVINRLQRNIVEAGNAAEGPAARAFSKLGLSLEEVKAMSPTEQLQAVARALQRVTNDAERTAIAQQLLGKSGGEIIPLLRAMDSELAKAQRQLGSYATAIDLSNKALDDIGDNFNAISAKGREFATGLLVNVAPALAEITTKIAEIDAAGFGMMLSDYVKKMLQAMSEAYRLGAAIDSIKLAIQSITQGNFADGLQLMWVTMKVTALNAINEIVKNFTAGFKTVQEFIATTFDSQGALALLMRTLFSVAAAYFKEQLYSAMASFMDAIGKMGMAETFRHEAETARKFIEQNLFSISSQIEEVGNQAAEAGRAMPENFEKHKASLNPIFDLTDVLDEQARLHELIGEELRSAESFTKSIEHSAKELAANLQRTEQHLQNSQILTSEIKMNLEGANAAAQNIPSAFDLSTNPTGQIKADLNNTAGSADDAASSLEEGSTYSGKIDINGRSFAQSASVAAGEIKNAKMDAKITSDLFKGLGDRMNHAVKNTSAMLEKMRETFHFGQKTQREIYEEARRSGKNILEASREAAEYTKRQEKASADLRRLENKVSLAEREHARKTERADDLEKRGYWRTADNVRRRAEASYTKKLEELRPELEKASENARRNLEKGSETIGKGGEKVGEGGKSAGQAMKEAGEKVGSALEEAADPFKKLADMIGQDRLALEQTLQDCRGFLENIDKNLPQNSLS